jgi:serine/threonine protein kinase
MIGEARSFDGQSIPKFARSEVTLGNVIGQGGFSLVFEVTRIKVDEVFDLSDVQAQERRAVADEAILNGHPRFAIKMLRDDLHDEEYSKGMIDLAVESRLLKKISHPNIVAMKATANSDPLESRFFVILEILDATLDDKINYWRKEINKTLSIWCGPFGYCCSNKPVLHQIWVDRITVSASIANAMAYLHNQNIIYRDLKPENIGFDEHGQVKIFDFGLAKKIYDQDRLENGLYRLTGNTGSLRYMAPEVALNQFYNLKVDTYSFAFVFWQICSLTIPFAGYNVKMHADLVLGRGNRPKIERSWPFAWAQLIRTCWSTDINERLDFNQICEILRDELGVLNNEVGDKNPSDIKAKKTKKDVEGVRLDIDTRKVFSDGEIEFSEQAGGGGGDGSSLSRRINSEGLV